MSRTIYLNITDTGTSVKVVENGNTIIEATPRENRALQLDEAAGKIRVLAHPNEAVLNDFDIYYNEVADKLGTTTVKEFYDKLIELRAFKVGGGGVQKQPDLTQTDNTQPDYVKNVDKAVVIKADRDLQLSDRGAILFVTGGFFKLTLQELGIPFGVTIDVDRNSQLTIETNGMNIINLSDDLVINATQNAKLYRLDSGDWVFMKSL